MIKELFKDMVKYIPAQVVPAIVGFIGIPIITRLFTPEDYGNYILVIATVNVFVTITGWLPMSIIRFYPSCERDKKIDEFYSNIIKLAVISILVISIAFSAILLFIKSYISATLYPLMWIGILVFMFSSSFRILQHFLRAKRQVNYYSGSTIYMSLMSLGIGIVFVIIFHFGVDGLLWGMVLSSIIACPLLWNKVIGEISLKLRGISTRLALEMMRYGFPLVVGNLAAWILSLSDRYMLELFCGSRQVGIYSASYDISEKGIMLIASFFLLASWPIEISIWENKGKKASQEFLTQLTRYYLIICLPAVIGLTVLAKPALSILTPIEYCDGYRIIPLVALGGMFLGLQRRFQSGLAYYKRTHYIMFCTLASGLLNLGLNFFFIPMYGYIAAAITTLVSYVFLLVLIVFISRRFFVWKFPVKTLANVSSASAIMGVVVYYIGNRLTSSILLNLILGISLGLLIYLKLLFFLREFNQRETQELLTLKRRIWSFKTNDRR